MKIIHQICATALLCCACQSPQDKKADQSNITIPYSTESKAPIKGIVIPSEIPDDGTPQVSSSELKRRIYIPSEILGDSTPSLRDKIYVPSEM